MPEFKGDIPYFSSDYFSQSGNEAFVAKTCLTGFCQNVCLAVQRLITIPISVYFKPSNVVA